MARLVVGWRRHLPTFVLAASVAASLWFILGYEACDATCSDWDYVHDLLLEEATAGRVRRWDHAPSVVVTTAVPPKRLW